MYKDIPQISEFPQDDRYWRVDWLGAIEQNPNISDELLFQVHISPFIEGADFLGMDRSDLMMLDIVDSEKSKVIRIGVGQLPLISIGSIWHQGCCTGIYAGKVKTSKKRNISSSTICEVRADYREGNSWLIPKYSYKLGRGLQSNLVCIKIKDDPFAIMS